MKGIEEMAQNSRLSQTNEGYLRNQLSRRRALGYSGVALAATLASSSILRTAAAQATPDAQATPASATVPTWQEIDQ
ncbi:MAG: hypothetical protein ACR2OU_13405 [Thermomicrobiales bacterium]